MAHLRAKLFKRSASVLFFFVLWLPATVVFAHYCWIYATQSAVNPQPWFTTMNMFDPCYDTNYLHTAGSTTGQTIGEEHRNWHCRNPVVATEPYGRAFLAFHRQFIVDFDIKRLSIGLPRLEIWDPYEDAPVPGDDETITTAFTNCSDADMPNPGDNIRPAGAICENCDNLPSAYIGSNLDDFDSLGEVGFNLDTGPNSWHGSYHNGVRVLGCDDIGGFLHTPRDPAFWMAHKKLDEISRDWQALQAADVVIVLDRSGSMDDNCSSTTPPPTESDCAINDAREAARTFANVVLDVRMDGGAPAAAQHRIGLVTFSSSASPELGLTAANGILSDDGIDNTPFETALAGISTGGATSIAAGIREAMTMLNGIGDPNDHQAILVLTDGKENTSPCLGGNSPSSCVPSGGSGTLTVGEVGDVQVVAIGFGAGAEEGNLRDVAERHGGIFLAHSDIDDAVGLQKFFVTAFGEIYDSGVSVDPRGVIQPGQAADEPFEIPVAPGDERLSVVLGYSDAGRSEACQLELKVFTPSGAEIRREHPRVEAGGGLRHDFVHVALPYEGEWEGTWMGQVTRPEDSHLDCQTQEYFYTVLIRGLGRIDPFVVRPNLIEGQPLLATFRISESNRPIGGFERVDAQVTLTRPGGSQETEILFDDGSHGDKLPDNNIWSYEFEKPAGEPGAYHLRGHFELWDGNNLRMREAEYSIVVDPEPEQCTTPFSGGLLNAFVQHRPQAGDVVPLQEVACLSNVCGTPDQYQLQITDSLNWLRTIDPDTGELIPLPRSFRTGSVAGFSHQCYGRGPDGGDEQDTIPLVAVIPEDARVGQQTLVSVDVVSANDGQLPSVRAVLEVYPPPDCNNNGIDDAEDIANGTVHDEDGNGVPDRCDRSGHFGQGQATYLPLIRR